MATGGILSSLNSVVNKTTTEMLDSKLTSKTAGVINTFITSGFEVVDTVLAKVQSITKEEEESP
jgi:hypothetical protein